MIVYEPERTTSIVQRLVLIGNTLRLVVILTDVVIIASLLTLVGQAVWPEAWWLFGMVGLAVGYGLGEYMAALLMAVVEWMAQLLISQNEVVMLHRRRSQLAE